MNKTIDISELGWGEIVELAESKGFKSPDSIEEWAKESGLGNIFDNGVPDHALCSFYDGVEEDAIDHLESNGYSIER